jgi:hypothetical protein
VMRIDSYIDFGITNVLLCIRHKKCNSGKLFTV